MLSLSDEQLAVVITAARGLPVEKRSVFLERVAARLQLRGSFADLDFDDAVRRALRALIQDPRPNGTSPLPAALVPSSKPSTSLSRSYRVGNLRNPVMGPVCAKVQES